MAFMGGGVPGLVLTMAGLSTCADLLDELEMKATGAPRNGRRAAVGLAVFLMSIHMHFLAASTASAEELTAQRHCCC